MVHIKVSKTASGVMRTILTAVLKLTDTLQKQGGAVRVGREMPHLHLYHSSKMGRIHFR